MKAKFGILLQEQEQIVMGRHISVQLSSHGEAVSQCGKLFIFGNFQEVFG